MSAARFRRNANELASSIDVLRRLLGVGETVEKDFSDHDA
jgi:hypothetical protein